MQLLYVANRYEKRPQIERWLATAWCWSAIATAPRASPTAKRRGSTRRGSPTCRSSCRRRISTILLDIAPETAAGRKTADRDSYERDLALLSRVRDSYRRQAQAPGWLLLDGERDKDAVAADVLTAVAPLLSRP